jgi:light-regulated signal transduction histidine kinase (bacteriophytochrome)
MPAKLIPVVNPVTKNFTDLSECNLRSVPAVHIEYLKNMGVGASMSTPIIIQNRLWGLISCHHKTSKFLNYEMRSAFELLSDIVSVQLAAKENEADLLHQSELNTIHARLLEQIYAEKNFVNGLTKHHSLLLDLFKIQGAAIVYDGRMDLIGQTPQPEEVKDLVKWLQLYNVEKVFATHTLSDVFSQSATYKDTASGVIALPVSVQKGNFILGFRPEVIQTIEWGGNPNQAIQFEPDGKTYHPRNSFAIWKETVKQASIPWSAQEVNAAEMLRTSILERILRDKS